MRASYRHHGIAIRSTRPCFRDHHVHCGTRSDFFGARCGTCVTDADCRDGEVCQQESVLVHDDVRALSLPVLRTARAHHLLHSFPLVIAATLCVRLQRRVRAVAAPRPPDDLIEDPQVPARCDAHTSWKTVESMRVRAMLEAYTEGRPASRIRQAVAGSPSLAILRMETISPGRHLTQRARRERTHRSRTYDIEVRTLSSWASRPPTTFGAPGPSVVFRRKISSTVLLGGPPLDAVVDDPQSYGLAWDREHGAYAPLDADRDRRHLASLRSGTTPGVSPLVRSITTPRMSLCTS